MKSLLSYGGGVNSTALAIWTYHNNRVLWEDSEVVFADTGGERVATYKFIQEVFKPWLKERNKDLVVVRKDITLEDYCLRDHVLPMRRWRWCTDKWKIRVINKWANKNIGKPRQHLIAIAAEEDHRARPNPDQRIINRFDLVGQGIDRDECKAIIEREGMTVPPKSGCFFCPLAPHQYFKDLYKEEPEYWRRAVAMEDNAKPYTLKDKSLREIVAQMDMYDDYDEDGCSSGYCFV